MGLGVPFNIASYSFLNHLIAHHCDLIAENFIYFMGNCHIYEDHISALSEQINNIPYKFPKILINNRYDNIEDYSYSDIEWIEEYRSYDKIKMKMIA